MKFIDLGCQYERLKQGIDEGIARVLNHGQYILGPEVSELEQQLAQYVGVSHCVVTSNGTTSLALALMALGVGDGDEVITTPFSFFASTEVIALLGAKPVFVDIDPVTYNLDPQLLEAAITSKTKAILPVNLYGQPADYTQINEIAQRHGLSVVEDAAQSFGAQQHGVRACALGTIGCTSFFPSKPLGCYGDGGACFTNDAQLAEQLRMLLNHGQRERYEHVMLGINGRLDSMQAAVLIEKLTVFDDEIARREQVASWYQDHLPDEVTTPSLLAGNTSVYGQYTIEVSAREDLQAQLQKVGVPTAVHYNKALHMQPAIIALGYDYPSLPVAERAAQRVLSLPFHPYMSLEQVNDVACAIKKVLTTKEVA